MTCDSPDMELNAGWRPIPIGKTQRRTFDFSDFQAIRSGATISSVAFERSDSSVVSLGSSTTSGSYVHVPITGDAEGDCLVTCHVTLSTGYTETITGGVKVYDPTDCTTW